MSSWVKIDFPNFIEKKKKLNSVSNNNHNNAVVLAN